MVHGQWFKNVPPTSRLSTENVLVLIHRRLRACFLTRTRGWFLVSQAAQDQLAEVVAKVQELSDLNDKKVGEKNALRAEAASRRLAQVA